MKDSWHFEGLHTPIWDGYALIVKDAGCITFNPKSEIRRVKTMQCFGTAMICNRRRCIKSILHSRFQTMDGQMITSDGPFLFRILGLMQSPGGV